MYLDLCESFVLVRSFCNFSNLVVPESFMFACFWFSGFGGLGIFALFEIIFRIAFVLFLRISCVLC